MSVITQWVIIGLIVIDCGLLFFVSLLGCQFYSLRNILIFKKRQSKVTILMGILIAIQLLERLLVLIDIIYTDMNDKTIPVYHIIVEVLQWTIDPFLSQGVLYSLLLKFYMIYYEINWTLSSLRLKWVLHINPTVGTSDYFLQKRKTFGNGVFVAKRYIGIYLASSCVSAFLFSFTYVFHVTDTTTFRLVSHFVDTTLFVIPVAACIWLRRRTPSFFDHFYVRDEMNIIIALCVLNVVFYFTIISMAFVVGITIPIRLSMILFGAVTLFIIFAVSTHWVVKRLKRDYGSIEEIKRRIGTTNENGASFAFIIGNMRSPNANHKMAEYIQSAIPNDNNPNNPNNQNDPKKHKRQRPSKKFREIDIKITNAVSIKNSQIAKKLKLHHILSKDESFELFMQHLSKEYNNEWCLLCFIEFVQFKILLKNNLSDIEAGTFGNPKLAPTIPKSAIVFSGEFGGGITRNSSNLLLANGMVTNNSSNLSNEIIEIEDEESPKSRTKNKNEKKKNDRNNLNKKYDSMSNNIARHGKKKSQLDAPGRHHPKMTEKELQIEYKCRAYLLYQKYIKTDGEFEIEFDPNSLNAREYKQTIVDKMDQLDNWVNAKTTNDDLFHQFDIVIHEMYKIMYHSYQSFLTTDDYKKCETLFKETATPGGD